MNTYYRFTLVPDRLNTYLDHFVDVALRASELRGVLDLDEDDEVEVVPHVVLVPGVLLERHVLVVESLPFQA